MEVGAGGRSGWGCIGWGRINVYCLGYIWFNITSFIFPLYHCLLKTVVGEEVFFEILHIPQLGNLQKN